MRNYAESHGVTMARLHPGDPQYDLDDGETEHKGAEWQKHQTKDDRIMACKQFAPGRIDQLDRLLTVR